EPRRQSGPWRAAPLTAAAGIRHELHRRQDPGRETARRAKAAAWARVHHETVHGRIQRGRSRSGLAAPLGADGTASRRREADAGDPVATRWWRSRGPTRVSFRLAGFMQHVAEADSSWSVRNGARGDPLSVDHLA